MGIWVRANWSALFMLVFIFLLALFVRSYFGFEMAADNGYIVSGGSDSYYWQRIIDYSVDTGKQLYWDPLINYPEGIRNPRPPLFSMSVAVPAVLAQDLFASLDDSVGMIFIWSTAFWGALTVIPTYFLGKEAFGRRAGLVAAFLLAVMPSHVQRSVLSEADHDGFILFFIVLTFYFVLKAVKVQEHRKWVENWRSMASIKAGLKEYFAKSRTAVLYALMAGVAYGCVIMAWVGFGYATVLILAYYLIQVLLNKFKNIDSLGVTLIIALSMGFGFLLSFPVYYEQSLIPVRFDVPVYLFLAALVFGLLFVVSRDFPWTLTFPAIAVLGAVGILGITIISPELGDAIMSGQGYFVKSKLYSTIAEARAPVFSELAMSFGMVTFFLSLIGLIWAVVKMPKHTSAEYIFIVVWLAAAIFMAISAGRFMFNAAPAFALAAAWVMVIIVDRLDFDSVRKSMLGASGSYWHVFKKSVKVRHVVGAVFLTFMIVVPNVWYAVDAGIPSESKTEYDKQIYFSFPSFMRPGGYDEMNGSNWYLGAFGYSLPLPSYYFPAAWDWFSQQDADIAAAAERPAYVSWWDYGFEAVQAGRHPTVADNFQNGYQLTGNILMAQNETEAIALFAFRFIQVGIRAEGGATDEQVTTLLEKYGVDSDRMHDIVLGPGQDLIDEILAEPDVYGPMADDLSEANARIVAARVELVNLGTEKLVSFYNELCSLTGWEIRYFNVDSRMFPRSARDTGIFYAPAKLSDRRLVDGSTPVDFYEIKAVDENGIEHDLDEVTADMTIVDYKIVYKDMFYDSMLYRGMAGYSGSDIALTDDGVPGLSGSVQKYNPMPGWNMTHFRMVYRTAYYNPYPVADLAGHRDAWTAISLEEAGNISDRIDAGEIEGYVDASATSYLSAGTAFLKYYMGAFVNGTLTTEQGYPVANIRVTVLDEYGIPHMTTFTDSEGKYSVLAPFGNVTVVLSAGAVSSGPSLIGSNVITRMRFNVTDDQAMRLPYDTDGDGLFDYIITKDYVMKGTQFTADIFWDMNQDGNYTAGTDELVPNTPLYATETSTDQTFTLNATDGSVDALLPPGQYDISAVIAGANVTVASRLNITPGAKSTQKLALPPGKLTGSLEWPDGSAAAGVSLILRDLGSGYEHFAETDSEGNFTFDKLPGSNFMLMTDEPEATIFNVQVSIDSGQTVAKTVLLSPSSTIKIRVVKEGVPVQFAPYIISNVYDPSTSLASFSDGFGMIQLSVPLGTWNLYVTTFDGHDHYAASKLLEILSTEDITGTLSVQLAAEVTGSLKTPKGLTMGGVYLSFESPDGARTPVKTDTQGTFKIYLPEGLYEVTGASVSSRGTYSGTVTVEMPSSEFLFRMGTAVRVTGTAWTKKDVSLLSGSDLGRYAMIEVTDSAGRTFTHRAEANGSFSIAIPKDELVTVSLGDPGYSSWSQTGSFAQDTAATSLVAMPDDVLVTGRVTCDGLEVRGAEVWFMPDSTLLEPVLAVTGAGGYYETYVPPSEYTVVMNQDTSPTPGERYMYSSSIAVLPSALPLNIDVQPVKKVEIYGLILGATSDIDLEISGPEEHSISLTTFNYSLYVLPGTYSIYATGSVGTATYANSVLAEVTATTRQYDLQLLKAYKLSGTVKVESNLLRSVMVTAVSETGTEVSTRSSVQGYYSLDLPPGVYTVSFMLEDSYSLGSQTLYVEYSGTETVPIVAAAVSLDLTLPLRFDNTTFSGTILGPDGNPVQAFVELTTTGKYGLSTSFLTSGTGAFSVSIQPGDYTMYVTRLVDNRVSLSHIGLARNVPLAEDIELEEGKFLAGKVTADGSGVSVPLAVALGGAKLTVTSGDAGEFSVLVPSGNYTITGSLTRIENGITITYSTSTKVTVGGTDVFSDIEMTRDTRRTVSVSWSRNLTQTALPGEKVTYVVTVTNTGNIEDTYTASYSGTAFNATFTPSQFTLDFGIDNKQTMIVELIPGDKVVSGDTKVTCLVRSKTTSSARADLNLYVMVSPSYDVEVKSLNASLPVSSKTTLTKFEVNNTGNIQDRYDLQVSNTQALAELGWTAMIVESTNSTAATTTVNVSAFSVKTLYVKFTATRSDAGPVAAASVLATSRNHSSTMAYGAVQVMLPDLVIGQGDIEAERDDVTYELDSSRLYIDLILAISLASLVATFFILRKRKGLGGGGKK